MASEKDRGNGDAIVTVIVPGGEEKIKTEVLNNLPIDVPLDERVLSRVGTSRGCTLNLGNYESARVDVWITVPCHVGQSDIAYEFVAKWCEDRVKEEVGNIKKGA